jgi:uncharacterized OB-fold protein
MTKVPVLDGWFTLDEQPHLLGSRCTACGTYYFPKLTTFCRNPDCAGEAFEEVPLSRTGKLWSFTNASYQPPEPYVQVDKDAFVPFAIAAVELAKEKMIVLGQVVAGVGVESLRAGLEMELVLEPLADGKLTWKWKPTSMSAAEGRSATPRPLVGEGETHGGAGGGERGAA